MASTTLISASSAGTKLPICAMATMTPSVLMYVDLPPMLGPVTIASRPDASFAKVYSLGMNESPPDEITSITGWRAARMRMEPSPPTTSAAGAAVSRGRTYAPPGELHATWARDTNTSSSPMTPTASSTERRECDQLVKSSR